MTTQYRFTFNTPRGTWKTDWLREDDKMARHIHSALNDIRNIVILSVTVQGNNMNVELLLTQEILQQTAIVVESKVL